VFTLSIAALKLPSAFAGSWEPGVEGLIKVAKVFTPVQPSPGE
jgi:hypothetical protein